jgi:hypothetical protein
MGKGLLVLCVFLFVSCQNRKHAKRSVFNPVIWKKETFEGRGKMVQSLLSMKDSLLIGKKHSEIEMLLGKADEETNTNMNYFFEMMQEGDFKIAPIQLVTISFDTLKHVSIDASWTD